MPKLIDTFAGDDAALIECIEALIELNDDGKLVPHGIGGHARKMLAAAAVRLSAGVTDPIANFRQKLRQGEAAGEAEAVVTVEAVCSNRPRPTVARSGKHGGGQWWARDVWHIAAAENKTLCGLDRSDWLTIGQTKLNSDCCKRCSRLYATPQPTETQRIVAEKAGEPIFLEMRDIYVGQEGYRTPGQIADAAWFTGQPNPGASIPASGEHLAGEGE